MTKRSWSTFILQVRGKSWANAWLLVICVCLKSWLWIGLENTQLKIRTILQYIFFYWIRFLSIVWARVFNFALLSLLLSASCPEQVEVKHTRAHAIEKKLRHSTKINWRIGPENTKRYQIRLHILNESFTALYATFEDIL